VCSLLVDKENVINQEVGPTPNNGPPYKQPKVDDCFFKPLGYTGEFYNPRINFQFFCSFS